MEKRGEILQGSTEDVTWPSSCVRDRSPGQVQVRRVHTSLHRLGSLTGGGPVGEAVHLCEVYIAFRTESAKICHQKLNMDGAAGTAMTDLCNWVT